MTHRPEFQVYLSSTVDDLQEERRIAREVLSGLGLVKDSYRASDEGVIATCIGDVRQCQLYVCILGDRYGYVPQADANPRHQSITELEYDACDAAPGRAAIVRLVFLRKNSPRALCDAFSSDPVRKATAPRIEAFRQRANGPSEVAYEFDNLDALRAELRIRVAEQRSKFLAPLDALHPQRVDHRGLNGGRPQWKHALTPVAIACVPGTDHGARVHLQSFPSDRFRAFELSPGDRDYLATADAGYADAQLGALLLTPASLSRLLDTDPARRVAAMVRMQVAASGHFALLCAGVDPAQLPAPWQPPEVRVAVLPEPVAGWQPAALYDQLRDLEPDLSVTPPLAVPYLVLAPTRAEVEDFHARGDSAWADYGDLGEQARRRAELQRLQGELSLAELLTHYGDTPGDWRCLGPGQPSAARFVAEACRRLSRTDSARERRALRDTTLWPRQYRLQDYLDDADGARAAVDAARAEGALILVDELALLMPRLRQAAGGLLSSGRGAVVTVCARDPTHAPLGVLTHQFSHLNVGTLLSRFGVDHDLRCEIALNSRERVERWLRWAIPELMLSRNDQEALPGLVARVTETLLA